MHTVPMNHRWARLALTLLLCLSVLLMFQAAIEESAIMDELAHIPAGYGYVRYFDFRLNPEHPPLLKAVAAVPLLFLDIKFPTHTKAWTTDVNGQWDAGREFLYELGNDADQIVRASRLGPILFTILLALIVFWWARELLGTWWALVPTLLFALSPNILAHGHYVTTDVVAAFGVALATYFFLKFLLQPSRKHLLWAGLAFGVAQSAKFSAVLLIPYFGVLLGVFFLASVWRDWSQTDPPARLKRFAVRAWRYVRSFALLGLIGYALVVYPLYYAFTLNYPMERQASETEYLLSTFAEGPTLPGERCVPMRCVAELNIEMAKHPLTRPISYYGLGVLMVIQRAAGGNAAYFLGQVANGGSHWYFPVVYALKEPLPVIAVVLVGILLGLRRMTRGFAGGMRAAGGRFMGYLERHFTYFAMVLFIAFYWAWSINSPLNIGFRHLFPTLPFIYILATAAWRSWIVERHFPAGPTSWGLMWAWVKGVLTSGAKRIVLGILLIWFFFETLAASPYFLSYFNQFGGGTWGGYRFVTDSNYDWGQDMLRLREFVMAHPEIDRIAVDYFGGASPAYYLGRPRFEPWWSARGNPADQGIRWLAISSNNLQGSIQPAFEDFPRKTEDSYVWFTDLKGKPGGMGNIPAPDYRVGTSIFIYKL